MVFGEGIDEDSRRIPVVVFIIHAGMIVAWF